MRVIIDMSLDPKARAVAHVPVRFAFGVELQYLQPDGMASAQHPWAPYIP
jgi:hypothetical protein